MKDKDFDFVAFTGYGGQKPDQASGSRVVPIYQTTSYVIIS